VTRLAIDAFHEVRDQGVEPQVDGATGWIGVAVPSPCTTTGSPLRIRSTTVHPPSNGTLVWS
jgi:hypothetical protein